MTPYPNTQFRTKSLKALNPIKTAISEGGVLRGQSFGAGTVYEITIEHPLLDPGQVSDLQGFYALNKNLPISTQLLSDNRSYSCQHVYEPEVFDDHDNYSRVVQRFVGTPI